MHNAPMESHFFTPKEKKLQEVVFFFFNLMINLKKGSFAKPLSDCTCSCMISWWSCVSESAFLFVVAVFYCFRKRAIAFKAAWKLLINRSGHHNELMCAWENLSNSKHHTLTDNDHFAALLLKERDIPHSTYNRAQPHELHFESC